MKHIKESDSINIEQVGLDLIETLEESFEGVEVLKTEYNPQTTSFEIFLKGLDGFEKEVEHFLEYSTPMNVGSQFEIGKASWIVLFDLDKPRTPVYESTEVSESEIPVRSIEHFEDLLAQTDVDIRLLGFGPFGEDEVQGRKCYVLSVSFEDAYGQEEELEGMSEIVTFTEEIGQSGCNWMDKGTFEEHIQDGMVVIEN